MQKLAQEKFEISIHALRGEGDKYVENFAAMRDNFNPRPPWGGRHWQMMSVFAVKKFQSTPSVGRATVQEETEYNHILFQSTPSVGRATHRC